MITIQKPIQRVFQAMALFVFLFALSLNVQTNINGTIDLDVEEVTAQVRPIEIGTECLSIGAIELGKRSRNDCKCYKEAPGPDQFQGFQTKCIAEGDGCNKVKCASSFSCYCI